MCYLSPKSFVVGEGFRSSCLCGISTDCIGQVSWDDTDVVGTCLGVFRFDVDQCVCYVVLLLL